MRCLLLLALTGCLVVPKTVDTTRQLETFTTPLVRGKVGAFALHVTESYATIHVTANHERQCTYEVRGRFEHHHGVDTDLVVADMGNDPRGWIAAAIISGPLLLVSGVISEGVSAIAPSSTEHYEQTLHVVPVDCPAVAADIDVDVILPSGTTLHGTTNANGTLSVAIPSSEPAQGLALLRAHGLERTVAYSLDPDIAFAPPSATVSDLEPRTPAPRPKNAIVPSASRSMQSPSEQRAAIEQRGFTAVRDALRACGVIQDMHGVVAAQLAIDTAGRVTSNPDRGGAAFATCVNSAPADARFPEGRAQKLVFPYQL